MDKRDPMIDILLDKNFIEMMSTLIAKMECFMLDADRTSVFKTAWSKSLFNTCANRMLRTAQGSTESFDIDDWFRLNVKHVTKVRRAIDPSLYQQPINADWLSILLDLELKFVAAGNTRGSLLKILYNILELEDSAHAKLSKYCKLERRYNFEGVTSPIFGMHAKLLAPASAPPPKPGSMEDLLSRK